MSEEQTTYLKDWIARNGQIKDEKWFEYTESFINHLWDMDEESYQMKKFLRNGIDYDELSSNEKTLYNEALSICSYIDELCGIWLYAKPYDWEPPE